VKSVLRVLLALSTPPLWAGEVIPLWSGVPPFSKPNSLEEYVKDSWGYRASTTSRTLR
jgi:hypothetical protein